MHLSSDDVIIKTLSMAFVSKSLAKLEFIKRKKSYDEIIELPEFKKYIYVNRL